MNTMKQYITLDEGEAWVILRTLMLGFNIKFIENLAATAKKDFPGLSYEEMDIAHYVNTKAYGVEFVRPLRSIPKEYVELEPPPSDQPEQEGGIIVYRDY